MDLAAAEPEDVLSHSDLALIEARLAADRSHQIKAVCVVHNETSTGCVTHPLEVRKILDRAKHPALLLVDELSLGLAPLVVQRLLDVLGELRDAGQTMVVVEQSLAVAARLTDRVVYVEKGAVRFDGAPAALTADEELTRAVFLGGPPDRGAS